MIVDRIENLTAYSALNPHIEKVVAFCRDNDLQQLPEGRFEIEGEAVFGTVMEMELRAQQEAKLETHRRYLDIQLVIEAEEAMGYAPLAELEQSEGYDQQSDLEFWCDPAQSFVRVVEKQMAIFFPTDAHMPLIGAGRVKKIVFKLAV